MTKLLKKQQRNGVGSLISYTPPSKCSCIAPTSTGMEAEQGTNPKHTTPSDTMTAGSSQPSSMVGNNERDAMGAAPDVDHTDNGWSISPQAKSSEETIDHLSAPTDDGATAESNTDADLVEEINNGFLLPIVDEQRDKSVVAINGYRWKESDLQLRYLYLTEETHWVDIQDAKADHPRMTAQRIVSHYTPRSRNKNKDQDDHVRKVRRIVQAKKKRQKMRRILVYKYGVEVPHNVKHALELDKLNGNMMWQDAMALEV
eukprot:1032605-Ditylum_brightwellii.AAC.1